MNTLRWQATLAALLVAGCASAVPAQPAAATAAAEAKTGETPTPTAPAAAVDTPAQTETNTETGFAGISGETDDADSGQDPADASPADEADDKEPGKFLARGKASYYHDKFQGRRTASGARFNQQAMTAAHRTLPFGTRVRVTNVRNGKSVVVTINDRGPYGKGRVIDVTRAAAQALGLLHHGLTEVRLSVLKRR